MQYERVEPKRISLRNHPEFNERWVHDRIVENPKLLGYVRDCDPAYHLKDNKSYIGLAKHGLADNFISFLTRKTHLHDGRPAPSPARRGTRPWPGPAPPL